MIERIFYRCNRLHEFGRCDDVAEPHTRSAKTFAERTHDDQIGKVREKRDAAFAAEIDVGFIDDEYPFTVCFFEHGAYFVPRKRTSGRCVRICKYDAGIVAFFPFDHGFRVERPVAFEFDEIERNIVKAAVYRIKAVGKFRRNKFRI